MAEPQAAASSPPEPRPSLDLPWLQPGRRRPRHLDLEPDDEDGPDLDEDEPEPEEPPKRRPPRLDRSLPAELSAKLPPRPDGLPIYCELGQLIAERRSERRLSSLAIASQVGIRPVSLKAIEHGKRRPNGEQLIALARVLRLPLEDLLFAICQGMKHLVDE